MVKNKTLPGIIGKPFDDTIDGYFPLHISLIQMLERKQFAAALVVLEYAPIIYIPDLPALAPVPMNIKAGSAGLIRKMTLCVTPNSICGIGHWRWLNEPPKGQLDQLNPLIRLAEPCFVQGQSFVSGSEPTTILGSVNPSSAGSLRIVECTSPSELNASAIWGPFVPSQLIFEPDCMTVDSDAPEAVHRACPGLYLADFA